MITKLKFAAVAVLLTAGIVSPALACGGHDFDHGYVPSDRMEQLSYGKSRVWNPEARVPADVGSNSFIEIAPI